MFFCFSHLIFFSYSLFSLCRSVVLLPCLVIGSAFEKKKDLVRESFRLMKSFSKAHSSVIIGNPMFCFHMKIVEAQFSLHRNSSVIIGDLMLCFHMKLLKPGFHFILVHRRSSEIPCSVFSGDLMFCCHMQLLKPTGCPRKKITHLIMASAKDLG